jgi:hypothetical protein
MDVSPEHEKARYRDIACPQAERIMSEELVSLHHVALMAGDEAIDRIAEAVGKVKDNVDELLEARQ